MIPDLLNTNKASKVQINFLIPPFHNIRYFGTLSCFIIYDTLQISKNIHYKFSDSTPFSLSLSLFVKGMI